jgi:hypothetical protein
MSFRSIQRGKWHSYELDGQRIPSVTALISAGTPKPNLIDWAAKSAAEYAADNLDTLARLERDAIVDAIKTAHRRTTTAAALKGGEIHATCEQLLAGKTAEYPAEHEGYINSYMQWLEDWGPQVIAVEAPVCNRRWRYGGRFDLLAQLDGQQGIVDVKTGGSGVWPETCLQLAAYRAAETMLDPNNQEIPMPDTQMGWALWLRDDGYELLPVECGFDVFAVFRHVAHVAAWMERAKTKDNLIGLPLAPPPAAVVS